MPGGSLPGNSYLPGFVDSHMPVRAQFVVNLPSRKLLLGKRTLIMGILNVTPDSFYDGNRYLKIIRRRCAGDANGGRGGRPY